jgi:hypothetical protein
VGEGAGTGRAQLAVDGRRTLRGGARCDDGAVAPAGTDTVRGRRHVARGPVDGDPTRGAGRAGLTARRLAVTVVAPSAVYLAAFALFTWPWALHPASRFFFTDTGDGYQNVWNMWWVDHSLTSLHQLPWSTHLLHYPYGTSLLGQTMNPFNGLVAILLLRIMPLVAAFNTMVVFSFVATGVTAFWLCRAFGARYAAGLVGGFVFTFSAYHLSKTLGLMQLVSLEWVPLFVLLWWRLLTAPRPRRAVAAALALLGVLLCDYYYFLFSVVAAGAIAVHLWRRGELALDRRSGVTFGLAAGALTAPLPLALILSNISDPMQGGHASRGTDLVSLVLDGGHWRFASLTHWYWGAIHAGAADATVYLSVTVTAILVVGFVWRERLGPHLRFWLAFAAVAFVLSLGPVLVVHGRSTGVPMPLAALKAVVPTLDYNIEPARIMVMTALAAAVVVALVLSQVRRRVMFIAVVVALAFEAWPASPPRAPVARPSYVVALRHLPRGGVIDDAAPDKSAQLYDAVVDGQPIAFGYISRTPGSVAAKDAALGAVIAHRRYDVLCRTYHFRYFTTRVDRPLPAPAHLIYRDATAMIYGLC